MFLNFIFQVTATDLDEGGLIYSRGPASSGFTDNHFQVLVNGTVVLLKALDFEGLQQFSFVIRVSDGAHSTSTKLEVLVIDVNDNLPQFSVNPSRLSIIENTMKSSIIGSVSFYSYITTLLLTKLLLTNIPISID